MLNLLHPLGRGRGIWVAPEHDDDDDDNDQFTNQVAFCTRMQVGNYIQPLWETVMPVTAAGAGGHLYNGAVEAFTTLTGASLSFALGYAHLNWEAIQSWGHLACASVGEIC